MNRFSSYLLVLVSLLIGVSEAFAQMPRERSTKSVVAEELFWAPSIVLLPSVTQLDTGNLDFTIQHAFGPVSGGIESLYGLDNSANIRFGFDYGVRDWLSVGVGRSKYDKVYDARLKARLMSGDLTHVSLFLDGAAETVKDGRSFEHRLSYFSGILLARKLSENVSLQLMPAYSHFNLVEKNELFNGDIEEEQNDHVVIGVALRFEANDRASFLIEYLPVIGDRSDKTTDVLSVSVDLEAGGHVFQVFVTSTQWITPQHAVSRSRDDFFDGDFGFGFNVHRVFGTR